MSLDYNLFIPLTGLTKDEISKIEEASLSGMLQQMVLMWARFGMGIPVQQIAPTPVEEQKPKKTTRKKEESKPLQMIETIDVGKAEIPPEPAEPPKPKRQSLRGMKRRRKEEDDDI